MRTTHVRGLSLLMLLALMAGAMAQTLVVALHQDLESTDPTVGGPIASVTYNMAVADHLVYMSEDGLEPWILERWEVTPDGVYTWHVRQGITFTDGTPLDAHAIIYNIERMLVPENNLRYGSYFVPMLSIEATDDSTIRLDMGRYDVEFMERMVNVAIVSPTAVGRLGPDFAASPVASGPFLFESYTPGERITLQRNPDYWRPGEPKIDTLIFRIIPETGVRMIELEAGTVHYAMNMAGADLAAAERAGLKLEMSPAVGRLVLYFNLERVTDVNVRRAVNHAIAREPLIETVTGGIGVPGYYAVPEVMWAYNPNVPVYEYDPERANQILDDAGWALGPDGVRHQDGARLEWTMPVENVPSIMRAAEFLAAMLSEIGIQVNIRPLDTAAHTAAARGGDHDLTLMQWASTNLDPWFSATDLHSNYSWNMAQSNEPGLLDPLIDAGLTTLDQDKRQAIYDAFFTYTQHQSLSVTLGFLPQVFVSRPEVNGVWVLGARLLFTEATVD
jgi:peptide/nickel transport system substrate-binding protein